MSTLRVLFTSALIALVVFIGGVRYGSRWIGRLPISLPISLSIASDADGLALPVPASTRAPQPVFVDPFENATADPQVPPEAVERVVPQPLKGIDLSGRLWRLGDSEDCRGIVLVFLATQCPIANSVIPRLNQLAAHCAEKHIEFYGVLSNPSETRAEANAHSQEFSIQFPVLFDRTSELRERFAATHSPHAFVLNAAGEVRFQGAIDNQFIAVGLPRRPAPTEHFLRDAIADLCSQCGWRTPHKTPTDPVGCFLERPGTEPVTFAREIAPILFANCTNCHRSGAVAPFPLLDYEQVKRHAAQIGAMVRLRQMPPWRPLPNARRFRDELLLSDREIQLVAAWVEAGSPLGDINELPPTPQFVDGWQLGTPDLVLKVEQPFAIPADGPDIYQYSVIPMSLPEDRLVTAIEYRAGNARVVHHASFRFDDAGNARRLDAATTEAGYQRFGGWGFESGGTLSGWSVGVLPQRFPSGFGRPLKAGSDFVLQTHYHPSGRAETDQAQLGIHFAPRSAQRRIGELIVANTRLRIPPNERRFVHRADYTVPVDVMLHAVMPHTHLLGREVRAVAILPGGQAESLITIDDWRFNWQSQYFYARPLRLPAGTRIEFEVEFDNSDLNPLNPHTPPRWVHWGEESSQEMAVCFFDVSAASEVQLEELIQHNREFLARQAQ